MPELAEHIGGSLSRFAPRRGEKLAGVGRNVDTFEALRMFAQREVRNHWRPGGFERFHEVLQAWAEAYTGNEHAAPLPFQETRQIAKSVAKWTWTRMTPEGFRAVQASRGRASGVSRRARTAERDGLIVRDLLAGDSLREVARRYRLGKSTVADIGKRAAKEAARPSWLRS